MAARKKWMGAQVQQQVGLLLGQRVRSATAYLKNELKKALSRPNPTGRDPSLPGEYAKKVTGKFVLSITSTYEKGKGRVGTKDPRGKWFEFGTVKMKPRPWLSNAFRDFGPGMTAILEKNQPVFSEAASDEAMPESDD